MLGMIARRLLSLIPVLLVVTFVVFMLTSWSPATRRTSIAGGANATPEKIAEVRDGARPRPPGARALRRLARRRGAARLRQVVRRATTTWPARPSPRRSRSGSRCRSRLALAGLFVAIVIGIPLGILAGMRPGGVVDRSSVTGDQLRPRDPQLRARASSSSRCSRSSLDWFPAQGYTKFSEDPGRVAASRSSSPRSRSASSRRRRSRARRAPRSSTCCSRTTCAPRSRSAPARGARW